jgi:decaprenylphospho-beta-D-erythro-pentofuranosid-2-ulose 2-reductase
MGYLLILGARSDIARAVAHVFARKGFNLYLAARRYEEADADRTDFEIRYRIKVATMEFDALNFEGHESWYKALPEKPSGVVCAIGYLGDQKKAERNPKEARRIIDTNYSGCVSVLDTIANDFEVRKAGFIIGISSVAGDRGRQSNYFYGSSKAAFSAYLSGLRNRLCRANVRVITVKPGFVRTSMTEDMDLPSVLTASAEEVAWDIFSAWKEGKDVIYTKWYWKYIMFGIRNIPERIFKKLSL